MEEKDKLSIKVANKIREEIKNGSFAVRTKIPPEPVLMQRYDVGRSTIREAVKSLTLSGILTVQQGIGTIVNEVSTEPLEHRLRSANFIEINYVRSILEKEIVALAAKHRTDKNLEEMNSTLILRKDAIQKNSQSACIAADIDFHIAIAKASGNAVLLELYASFTHIIRDFFSKREPKGITHFALSHHLHESLYQSIMEKDLDKSQNIINTILNNNH